MSQTRSPERLTIRLDASGANHANTSMNNPNANTLRTRNALFIAHQPSSLSSFAAMPSAQIVQLYLKFGYVKPTVWLKTTSETISAGFLASRRLAKEALTAFDPLALPAPILQLATHDESAAFPHPLVMRVLCMKERKNDPGGLHDQRRRARDPGVRLAGLSFAVSASSRQRSEQRRPYLEALAPSSVWELLAHEKVAGAADGGGSSVGLVGEGEALERQHGGVREALGA